MTELESVRSPSGSVPNSDLEQHKWSDAIRFIPYWSDLYWDGVARSQAQGAQPGDSQLGRAKGTLEDASANHGLKIGGDPLPERPKPRGRANKMVWDAHREMCPELCPVNGHPRKAKTPA